MNSEPLSNEELRQLIESNARAVLANSDAIAELRTRIQETRDVMEQGFVTVSVEMATLAASLDRLTRLSENFFLGQGRHNRITNEVMENHETRITQLEAE